MMAFATPLTVNNTMRRPRALSLGKKPANFTHQSQKSYHCLQGTRASVANSATPTSATSPIFRSSPETSCGFAALVGPSNVGKSTLMNHILGQKVAIVSPKVQTTRCRVSGIATFSDAQVIFLDTPGVFSATNRLSRAMVKAAWSSFKASDAAAIILDAAAMYYDGKRSGKRQLSIPQAAYDLLKAASKKSCSISIVANKIDAVPSSERQFVEEELKKLMEDHDLGQNPLWLLSAKDGSGVESFCNWVAECMPKGPWLYPDDSLTEMPSRLIAEEVTREKTFYVLRQELPYEITIETSSYKEQADGSIRIAQDILVRRDSQKRIVTGQNGQVVKKIGMTARQELKEILGAEVHLILTVKVRNKWKEDRSQYERWGLDFDA